MEENGNESWIALINFAKFESETNKQIVPSYLDRKDISIVVRLSEVDYIEIF